MMRLAAPGKAREEAGGSTAERAAPGRRSLARAGRAVSTRLAGLAGLVLLLWIGAFFAPAALADAHPGFRTLGIHEKGEEGKKGEARELHLAVWYPAGRAPLMLDYGDWVFSASRNAPPVEGRHPLILLSHDTGGSRFSLHSLAAALSRKGFVVLGVTHQGDHLDDMSALFTSRQLFQRARELSAALDAALGHPDLSGMIDADRVGVLGVGPGATAALLLVGGRLQAPERLLSPPEPVDEAFAAPATAERNGRGPADGLEPGADGVDEPESAVGPARLDGISFTAQAEPEAAQAAGLEAERAEEEAEEQAKESARVEQAGGLLYASPWAEARLMRMAREKDLDRSLTDPRVRAAALVAPWYGMFVSARSLTDVSVPVLILAAEQDARNPSALHAEVIRQALPLPPTYSLLRQADASSLLSPCAPRLAETWPEICRGTSPERRKRVQEELAGEALRFFHKTLGR